MRRVAIAVALASLAAPVTAAANGSLSTPPVVKLFPRPPLSFAQARWFAEHESGDWAKRHVSCWRLSPATVACSMQIKDGFGRHPWTHLIELVEYTGTFEDPNVFAPVHVWLATSGIPLGPGETVAVCQEYGCSTS